jgi:hypothetical protein
MPRFLFSIRLHLDSEGLAAAMGRGGVYIIFSLWRLASGAVVCRNHSGRDRPATRGMSRQVQWSRKNRERRARAVRRTGLPEPLWASVRRRSRGLRTSRVQPRFSALSAGRGFSLRKARRASMAGIDRLSFTRRIRASAGIWFKRMLQPTHPARRAVTARGGLHSRAARVNAKLGMKMRDATVNGLN